MSIEDTALSGKGIAVISVLAAAAFIGSVLPSSASAHCDSMDGPIVPVARRALETGEITPVLKWIPEEYEAMVRGAFVRARAIRSQDNSVSEVADLWFIETLIRVHREGEGEPYTGLKPAGSMSPVFAAADAALDAKSVDELANKVADAVRRGIKERFDAALEKRKHADESVVRGREYVKAYVTYMHFVEAVHGLASTGVAHDHFASKGASKDKGHEER